MKMLAFLNFEAEMEQVLNRDLTGRKTVAPLAKIRPFFLLIAAGSIICSSNANARSASAKKLDRLADSFVAQSVIYDPTIAYSSGLPTSEHDRFADRAPRALAAWDTKKKIYLQTLATIDPAGFDTTSRATYAILKEQLEADLQMRVCKTELWNVNHLIGWQSAVSSVAQQQPVGTNSARKQALKRWGSLPAYIDVEIANLKRGLVNGYSAPKSVVQRVIGQVDRLTTSRHQRLCQSTI